MNASCAAVWTQIIAVCTMLFVGLREAGRLVSADDEASASSFRTDRVVIASPRRSALSKRRLSGRIYYPNHSSAAAPSHRDDLQTVSTLDDPVLRVPSYVLEAGCTSTRPCYYDAIRHLVRSQAEGCSQL